MTAQSNELLHGLKIGALALAILNAVVMFGLIALFLITNTGPYQQPDAQLILMALGLTGLLQIGYGLVGCAGLILWVLISKTDRERKWGYVLGVLIVMSATVLVCVAICGLSPAFLF